MLFTRCPQLPIVELTPVPGFSPGHLLGSVGMDEEEEYRNLRAAVDDLLVSFGRINDAQIANIQCRATILLYKSNKELAASSEKLAKRNLWLTVAVLVVAGLQLIVAGLQVWISLRPVPAIVLTKPALPGK
jgi:hypothetical protein